MFEAKLKIGSCPELDPVVVEFPIPEDRYEDTIRVLENINIGRAGKQDCRIEEVFSANCPGLGRLVGTMANVDELDWLGRQLEAFDAYELLQFQGAAERFELQNVEELIDLTFCSNGVTVISDFSNLEKAGRRHFLTTHDGACSAEELKDLDGRKTTLSVISNFPGHVTQHGVVYDNGIRLTQVYNRKCLPQGVYLSDHTIMEVEMKPAGEDNTGRTEWLQLPVSLLKLERAMLRAEIPSMEQMQIRLTDCSLPDELVVALDIEHESLYDLNELCKACASYGDWDYIKLGAVCQMAKPESAANLRQLLENVDLFDFVPGVHTPEEYGKYMIQRSGRFEYDENLEGFYNYSDYGVQRMLQEDGMFIDRGYVAYHGTLPLEELMRDDPAESYRQEIQMNGM